MYKKVFPDQQKTSKCRDQIRFLRSKEFMKRCEDAGNLKEKREAKRLISKLLWSCLHRAGLLDVGTFSFYLSIGEFTFRLHRNWVKHTPQGHLFGVFKNLWAGTLHSCGKHAFRVSATVSLNALKWSSALSKLQCMPVSLSHTVCSDFLSVSLHHLTWFFVCRWALVQSQTGKWSSTILWKKKPNKHNSRHPYLPCSDESVLWNPVNSYWLYLLMEEKRTWSRHASKWQYRFRPNLSVSKYVLF